MFESRTQYILDTLGPKLAIASFEDDNTFKKLISLSSEEEVVERAQQVIKHLEQADPTKNKQYLQWLANKYIQKTFKIEDVNRMKEDLEDFEKYKRILPEKDINKYKHPADLFAEIVKIKGKSLPLSNKQKKNAEEQQFYDTKEATLLYDDDTIKVVIPHTEKASCFFGVGTRWCTASTKSSNYFNMYNKDGPLYIIFTPKGRFQLHFPSKQYMNELDSPISLTKLTKDVPQIKKALNKVGEEEGIIALVENPSEQAYNKALKKAVEALNNHYYSAGIKRDLEELLLSIPKKFYNEHVVKAAFMIGTSFADKLFDDKIKQKDYYQRVFVRKNPTAFQHMDKEFQTKEFVEDIALKTPQVIQWARPELLDEKFLIDLMKGYPTALQYVSEEKQTIPVISAAVKSVESKAVKRSILSFVHDVKLREKLKQILKDSA